MKFLSLINTDLNSKDSRTVQFRHGKYLEILLSFAEEIPQLTQVLNHWGKDGDGCVDDIINDIIKNHCPEDALMLACVCLSAFVQENWTGPSLDAELAAQLGLFPDNVHDKTALDSLSADREDVYQLTRWPQLLLLSVLILNALISNGDGCLPESHWWLARCLFVQQQLLENPSDTLFARIERALEMTEFQLPSRRVDNQAGRSVRVLWAKFHLFHGLVQNYYHHDQLARKQFQLAQEAVGLNWEMTGALGRRTKFQDFDVAQLTLLAKSGLSISDSGTLAPCGDSEGASGIPKTLDLNDDTLLEKIKFTEETNIVDRQLTDSKLDPVEQCILLAFCLNVKNTNPRHGLTNEQMMPFITRIIEQPFNWLVHTLALLLRSRLESVKSRTVERAVFQLQALVDQYPLTDPKEGGAGVRERMEYFWEIPMPSRWHMEKEMGERWMSVGMAKSALEIFKRLLMWDEVIACHQITDDDEKAEKVVRTELEKCKEKPSPKLLCILGDLTKDPECWRKAWEVSEHHYTRAMRSLGSWHYKHGEFKESIECYKKALAINALFEHSWFTLGCAAMQIKDWETAQTAFMRCISLEAENGEAWNNLAAVYINTDHKRDALRCLREGLKDKQDNWKMWENFLFIALDVGEFSDAILGFEKLLSLQWGKDPSAIDLDALRHLSESVIQLTGTLNQELLEGENDADVPKRKPFTRILERLESLLKTVSEHAAKNPEMWQIYSDFHKSQGNQLEYLNGLVAAYRAYNQSAEAEKISYDRKVFEKFTKLVKDLVEAYKAAQNSGQCQDGPFQSRLILKSILKRTRENFEGTSEFEDLDRVLAESCK